MRYLKPIDAWFSVVCYKLVTHQKKMRVVVVVVVVVVVAFSTFLVCVIFRLENAKRRKLEEPSEKKEDKSEK